MKSNPPMILAALLAVLVPSHIVLMDGHAPTSHVRSGSAVLHHREVYEPHPWPDGYSREDQQIHTEEMMLVSAHDPVRPNAHAPLRDRDLLRRFEEAQEIVRQTRTVEGFWEWEAVRQAVLDFGSRYQLDDMLDPSASEFIEPAFMWYISTNSLGVFPMVRQFSNEQLAELLVHEATHVVVQRMFEVYSGMTNAVLDTVFWNCQDMAVAATLLQEGLAFRNEGVWALARREVPKHEIATLAAAAWLEPTNEVRQRLRERLMVYASALIRAGEARSGLHSIECGPIVSPSGPWQGEWFDPLMLSPDFMMMLFPH